jgi:hypothetical protein
MSYTTINDLQEQLIGELLGSEYLLITDPDTTYKVSLDTLTGKLVELSAGSYAELTNKVIDSVTNFVHANAIHFAATAVGDIPKGTPVKLVESSRVDVVLVAPATSNDDTIIGICEAGLIDGQLGEIMVMGILKGIDVSAYTEGDMLYYQNGTLTNNPNTQIKSQAIGYVLDANTAGRILVTNTAANVIARNVNFDNTGTNITATDVQSAIAEIGIRKVVTTSKILIVNNEITLPTKAIGGIMNNIAKVYKTQGVSNVFTEYTCIANSDGTKVLFDSADQLSGYPVTVTYFSAV